LGDDKLFCVEGADKDWVDNALVSFMVSLKLIIFFIVVENIVFFLFKTFPVFNLSLVSSNNPFNFLLIR